MENKEPHATRRRRLLEKMGTHQKSSLSPLSWCPLAQHIFSIRYMINSISGSLQRVFLKKYIERRFASQVKRSNDKTRQLVPPRRSYSNAVILSYHSTNIIHNPRSSIKLFEALVCLWSLFRRGHKQRIDWPSFARGRLAYFWAFETATKDNNSR
jgi:hypothetical protein